MNNTVIWRFSTKLVSILQIGLTTNSQTQSEIRNPDPMFRSCSISEWSLDCMAFEHRALGGQVPVHGALGVELHAVVTLEQLVDVDHQDQVHLGI